MLQIGLETVPLEPGILQEVGFQLVVASHDCGGIAIGAIGTVVTVHHQSRDGWVVAGVSLKVSIAEGGEARGRRFLRRRRVLLCCLFPVLSYLLEVPDFFGGADRHGPGARPRPARAKANRGSVAGAFGATTTGGVAGGVGVADGVGVAGGLVSGSDGGSDGGGHGDGGLGQEGNGVVAGCGGGGK